VNSLQTPYERLGGEPVLVALIDDFVERVVSDVMIGFFFRQIDKDKLKKLEVQFASTHLGGPNDYQGRPLKVAHQAHAIMGGQFNRRLRILENTLRDHGVDPEICDLWLAHNEQLRAHITRDTKNECNDVAGAHKGRDS